MVTETDLTLNILTELPLLDFADSLELSAFTGFRAWWSMEASLANLDNNTFETATDMTGGVAGRDHEYGYGNFYLGAADPVDYYKFTVTEPGRYHYGAYDADNGGAKQTLYDANYKQLDSRKVSAYEVEELPTAVLAAGEYYLKLEWVGNVSEDYNLGLMKA